MLEGQHWTLRFQDEDTELLYLRSRFMNLCTPLFLTLVILSNVAILVFLIVDVVTIKDERERLGEHAVALIIFGTTLLAEAVLLTVPTCRWLRGFLYIVSLSYIFTMLTDTKAYEDA